MVNPTSFRDLIEKWGGISAFAADLNLEYVTAQKMAQRNSVAVRHWPKLLQRAPARGFALTSDDLVRFAKRQEKAA